MEIDEVDDVAVHDAIDDVAERAAEHQRQPDREQRLVGADPPQPDHQHEADDHREADEEPALPAGRLRRMLKAAPVFSRYTMSRIGSSAMLSCSFTVPITSALVAWSRITTKNDSHSQLLRAARRREPDFRQGIGSCAPPLK